MDAEKSKTINEKTNIIKVAVSEIDLDKINELCRVSGCSSRAEVVRDLIRKEYERAMLLRK